MSEKFFGKNAVRVSNDPGNALAVVIRAGTRETALTPAQYRLAQDLAKAGNAGLKVAAETASFDTSALSRAGLRVAFNNISKLAVMHGELNEPIGFLIDANAAPPTQVERAPWPQMTREVEQPDTRLPWERARR